MSQNDKYILYQKIATGGMAEVFLSKHVGEDGFQRPCCVKRILSHYASDAGFVQMFRDEAHICKRLQHANIVSVEGFEAIDDSYAIIMEFINGADLKTLLAYCEKKRRRIPVPIAIFIVAEAARGLQYAHTKRDDITNKPLEIVHRDISPQNILVSFQGEVKITDFGIAEADNKITETKTGVVKGKYSYMSPEQISGQMVDARSDIFALSVVLWELLALVRLFHGDNEAMTIQLVMECQITKDISTLNPNVTDTLKNIIYQGLAKDSKDRFLTAAALEKELRIYLNQKFPDFTASDLADFMNEILGFKHEENNKALRSLLEAQIIPDKESEVTVIAQVKKEEKPPEAILPGPVLPEVLKIPLISKIELSKDVQEKLANLANVSEKTQQPLKNKFENYRKISKVEEEISFFQKNIALICFSYLSLLMIFSYLYYPKFKMLFSDNYSVEIVTTPSSVIVILDGKTLYNGLYLKTPLELKNISRANDHTITLKRDGFSSETIIIPKDYKDSVFQKEIVLTDTEKMAPIKLESNSKQNKIAILLDRGLIFTEVENNALFLKNITFGKKHNLFVYPEFPSKKNVFLCEFTPRSISWDEPFVINIDNFKKECSYPLR